MTRLIILVLFFLSSRLSAQQDFVRDLSFLPPNCIKGVESMVEDESGSIYISGTSSAICTYLDTVGPLLTQNGIVKLKLSDASYDPSMMINFTWNTAVQRSYLSFGDSLVYLHQNFGANFFAAMRYDGTLTDTLPTLLSEINDSTKYKFDWFHKYYQGVGNFIKLQDGTFILTGDLAILQFFVFPVTIAHVVKFDQNKMPDSTFISGVVSFASGNIVPSVRRTFEQDNKIIVTGYFDKYNGYFSPGIVRIDKNGAVDTTFRSPFQRCEIVNITEDKFGRFLMSGGATIVEDVDTIYTSFWRLRADGSIDSSFNYRTNLGLYQVIEDSTHYSRGVCGDCEWVELYNGYLVFTQGFLNTAYLQATYQGLTRSLMVLDANGFILPQYFQNLEFLGFTQPLCLESNSPNLVPNEYYQLASLLQARDGRIFVGGYYCGFDGEYVAGSIMAFFPPASLLNASYKENSEESKIVIAYPNPVNSLYHVEATISKAIRPDLTLIDATGRVMISIPKVPLPYDFDLSDYVPGIYYLQVRESKDLQVLKVMVSNH